MKREARALLRARTPRSSSARRRRAERPRQRHDVVARRLRGRGRAVPARQAAGAPGAATSGHIDALVAPLRDGGEIIGVLFVGNRLGDVSTFDGEDLKLFEALANHASVSLENRRLVDRLRPRRPTRSTRRCTTRSPGCRTAAVPPSGSSEALAAPTASAGRPSCSSTSTGSRRSTTRSATTSATCCCRRSASGCARVDPARRHRRPPRRRRVRRPAARRRGAPRPPSTSPTSIRRTLERPFHARRASTLDVGASDRHRRLPAARHRRRDAAAAGRRRHVRGQGDHAGVEHLRRRAATTYSPQRLALVGELRRRHRATASSCVHYQPKADARAPAGSIGVEALVRWHHPTRGTVPPDEFIPLAEHTGLIRPLTRFVLDAGAAPVRARGGDAGHRPRRRRQPVAAQPARRRARRRRRRACSTHVGPAGSAADARDHRERDHGRPGAHRGRRSTRLRRLGRARSSIDDFGTGYSSLVLPEAACRCDEIKIDRVVRARTCAERRRRRRHRAHRSSTSAATSACAVVAEGVEDEATWARLAALGLRRRPGLPPGQPMPAEDLTRWLAEHFASYATRLRSEVADSVPGPAPTPALENPAAGSPPDVRRIRRV